MANVSSSSGAAALARQARDRFADEAAEILNALPNRIVAALEKPSAKKTVSGTLEAMEAEAVFRQKSGAWREAAQREWRKARELAVGRTDLGASGGAKDSDLTRLALVDNDEMDRKVAAARLTTAIQNQAGRQLSDLRVRMQRLEPPLEKSADFAPGDVFRPETFVQALLKAWVDCGLTRLQWDMARAAIDQHVAQGLGNAYERANAFLTERGITAEIDLRTKVRRTPDRNTNLDRLPGQPSGFSTLPSNLYSTPGGIGAVTGLPGYGAVAGSTGGFAYAPPGSAGRAQYEAALYSGGPGLVAGAGGPVVAGMPGMAGTGAVLPAIAGMAPGGWGGGMVGVPLGMLQRQRAQSVLGSLCQFAAQYGVAVGSVAQPVSPVLALALAEPALALAPETQVSPEASRDETTRADLDQAARKLKDKAEALKDKAEHPNEKAVIEIVSLMFQAILADDRIPLALRAWFGRLQMPVLRVALAEPEFFAEPDHPARRFIDRMGACALGLDPAEVDSQQLEQEVKRLVQLIEQYPETGKKVFQLALDEFEKFLGRALAQSKPTQKFATLAQQIEQKDALTIQYTIELRNMLGALRVGEDMRQFLLRVWSEVLALAAVRRGAQDVGTMRFKQAAIDLLWAVSPKLDRAERQQVVQYLPDILKTLREGMQTLAMQADEQDGHIHRINQAVAQAFNSPGQGITPAQMNELARALTGLEDVVTDDPEGDLLLDPALLEQMLDVDSKDLLVIAAGGTRPGADMLQWASELQPGQWFTLQYQGATTRAQYVWRSARGQLHLFAAPLGKSYLVQTRRLASYLQAGLIAPVEGEALTIRATRAALTQLGQAPQQLLD